MIQTSEQIDQIADAIAKAQATLENINKAGKNPHFKSNYATLADVLTEVRGKFAEQGVAIIQMPVNGEGSNIGVATRLAHKSGQWIESVIFVAPTKFDAQGVGSVQSYLRRYSLMAMAGLGAEDDDGEAAVGRPQGPPQRAGMVRAADVPPNGNGHPSPHARRDRTEEHDMRPSNGNGTVLPVSPEEPPEMRLKRAAIRIANAIHSAPTDHICDVVMDDARDELAEIEAVKEPIFKFPDGVVNGIEAAKRLRTRHNIRISELRAGK